MNRSRGNEHIGELIHNRIEYHAIILWLKTGSEKGCTEVELRGGSQLIVYQIRDDWKTDKPHLRKLSDSAQELADEFEQFEIQHILREENREGDALVEQAFAD